MIIVKLQGGLGNQIFQYAFGQSIAAELGVCVKYDLSFYKNNEDRPFRLNHFKVNLESPTDGELKVFGLDPSILGKISRRIFKRTSGLYINEWNDAINVDSFLPQDNYFYDGYWQHLKYFRFYENDVKELISRGSLSTQAKTIEQTIKASACSVGVHVRRGDYILNTEANAHHGVLSEDYYERAFARMTSSVKGALNFFIFSDDPQWVQETFTDSNMHAIPMNEDYEDLTLLSMCQHTIIANSSFSWWASFLNKNEEKIIIAPKKWILKPQSFFKEPQLNSWILI